MMKRCRLGMMIVVLMGLPGCLGELWTGASMVYDRHHVYHQVTDYRLSVDTYRLLHGDGVLKEQGCQIEYAVFNRDILLAGHVPTKALRDAAVARIQGVLPYRRLFNQLAVGDFGHYPLEDAWITTKIRSQIFADASINPKAFKVVTVDHLVYLLGDVQVKQSKRVLEIARNTTDVLRVVNLFQLYKLAKI